MATDGPTPQPCDREIFLKGSPVAALSGASNAVERWVRSIAKKAHTRVDWHYSGGIAQVLHLGDEASRNRAIEAMRELEPQLKGQILRIFEPTDTGLYRRGVTATSQGTIAAYYEGDDSSTYIVDQDEQ